MPLTLLLLSLKPFWHKHLFCQPAKPVSHSTSPCNNKISLTVCSFPSFIYLYKYCYFLLPPLTCRCCLLDQKHGRSTGSYTKSFTVYYDMEFESCFCFPSSILLVVLQWLFFLYYVYRYVDFLFFILFFLQTYILWRRKFIHIYC